MANIFANYGMPVTANLTPQSQTIPGRAQDMAPNNAGGMSFKLDDWARLERFLILSSEGGTYYVGAQKLTAENAACVIRCLKADGERVVAEAKRVNVQNLAPKVDSQLFALALALKHGDLPTRRAAASAAAVMLRTGTHILHFVAMVDNLKGWGNLKKRIISNWVNNRDADSLAYQMLKYRSRA
jgi:60 kDa SS-A/Ro ribonucleoprotein